MTDTLERPAETDDDTDAGKDKLARALDIAGVCAAVVLGVILFDVFSGGRLTRWVQARQARGGPGPSGKTGPCEGCGGDDPVTGPGGGDDD